MSVNGTGEETMPDVVLFAFEVNAPRYGISESETVVCAPAVSVNGARVETIAVDVACAFDDIVRNAGPGTVIPSGDVVDCDADESAPR